MAVQFDPEPPITVRSHDIAIIGTGFIVADIQLAAYAKAGFNVVGIAGRSPARTEALAASAGIPNVYETPQQLIEESDAAIIDIAYPPHLHPGLVRAVLESGRALGVLVQKPAALTYAEATALWRDAEQHDVLVSVNQNMRYDQSIRALRQLLDAGVLGDPVVASIDMRAVPHWQAFLEDYDRLTILNMAIHHLDVLRYLFGEPRSIAVTSRPDPRTSFSHTDGIVLSHLQWDSGLIASSIEDVWAGPDGTPGSQRGIRWRVEGTSGVAEGTIGWPDYPDGSPSTISYTCEATNFEVVSPTWETQWFPDAFVWPMHQLQAAIDTEVELELSLADHLRTMALIEAGYESMRRGCAVDVADIVGTTNT